MDSLDYPDYIPTPTERLMHIIGGFLLIVLLLPVVFLAFADLATDHIKNKIRLCRETDRTRRRPAAGADLYDLERLRS
jgi:hypothetical protein